MIDGPNNDPIADRAAQLAEAEFNANWRDQIIGRLAADKAVDLSDAEIERCLSHCVGGQRIVGFAKMYRHHGYLTIEMIYPAAARMEAAVAAE